MISKPLQGRRAERRGEEERTHLAAGGCLLLGRGELRACRCSVLRLRLRVPTNRFWREHAQELGPSAKATFFFLMGVCTWGGGIGLLF